MRGGKSTVGLKENVEWALMASGDSMQGLGAEKSDWLAFRRADCATATFLCS